MTGAAYGAHNFAVERTCFARRSPPRYAERTLVFQAHERNLRKAATSGDLKEEKK